MDPATLGAIVIGGIIIVTANVLEGGNPAALLLPAPILLVFGASFAASIAGGTLADTKSALVAAKDAVTAKASGIGDLVPQLVKLAEKARREGLLALESAAREIEDPFLQKGVQLAVDGTDPDETREILEAEVYARRKKIKQDSKFYTDLGAYAPTFGIVGTVMGLVHVLENLSDPNELGHLIAAAFVATLWGVLSANWLFLPLGNRVKRMGDLDVARMEVVIEGVMAIQAGANPRTVAQKLRSLVPEAADEAKAA